MSQITDEDYVPLASFVQVFYCDNCTSPHVLFVDDDGAVIGEAIIGGQPLADLIAELQKALVKSGPAALSSEGESNARH